MHAAPLGAARVGMAPVFRWPAGVPPQCMSPPSACPPAHACPGGFEVAGGRVPQRMPPRACMPSSACRAPLRPVKPAQMPHSPHTLTWGSSPGCSSGLASARWHPGSGGATTCCAGEVALVPGGLRALGGQLCEGPQLPGARPGHHHHRGQLAALVHIPGGPARRCCCPPLPPHASTLHPHARHTHALPCSGTHMAHTQ